MSHKHNFERVPQNSWKFWISNACFESKRVLKSREFWISPTLLSRFYSNAMLALLLTELIFSFIVYSISRLTKKDLLLLISFLKVFQYPIHSWNALHVLQKVRQSEKFLETFLLRFRILVDFSWALAIEKSRIIRRSQGQSSVPRNIASHNFKWDTVI